jgi:hypothetical protein
MVELLGMRDAIAFGCIVIVAGAARAQQPVPTIALRPGLVITHSVRVAPRTYRLPADSSLDSAVITIRGDDITVDFTRAEQPLPPRPNTNAQRLS